MTEPAPPAPEVKRDDDLEDFDLPFFQRLALRLQVVVLEILTRITDVLLLLWRPRLLWPYLGIWWAEIVHTPYRARRTFEVVRALKATGQRFRELIYGETPLMTALYLFKRAGVGRESRFVDLGAGRGRVLIAARWLGAEARGVELIGDHVTRVAPKLQAAGITLAVGDMTLADLGDATHLFTNWLALTPETKSKLVERFRTCRPGTRILTVTRPIEAEDFVRLSQHWALFTWGVERVWLHEYRPR
ncbi:MAG TPA: class I SAM-dependent methyltransferase [Hyalangium sp.]|nr:class I SAM-dependent methyltransferase [Hyalangium sp.]